MNFKVHSTYYLSLGNANLYIYVLRSSHNYLRFINNFNLKLIYTLFLIIVNIAT